MYMEGIGGVDGWKGLQGLMSGRIGGDGFDDDKRRFYDLYVCWKQDAVGRYLISNSLTIFLPCTFQ